MADAKLFKIKAKETMTRTYNVLGLDEADARKRLHLHWKDAEMLREGIITEIGEPEVGNREIPKDGVQEIKSRANGVTPRGT